MNTSEATTSTRGIGELWDSFEQPTKQAAGWLGAGILALLVASVGSRIAARLIRGSGEAGFFDDLAQLFSIDGERNVPALVSGALFLATAVVCFLAANAVSGQARLAWIFFGATTAAMACDEVFEIHERLLKWVGESAGLTSGGVIYFVWVIPGFLLALAMVAVAVVLTRPLESWVRRGALLAAVVFFSGALGVESITGILFDGGGSSLLYVLLQTVEEGLEFFGIALMFVVAFQSLRQYQSAEKRPLIDTGARGS